MSEWLGWYGGYSAHPVAMCVAHRYQVFLQGWGPDAGRWCHLSGWPCE